MKISLHSVQELWNDIEQQEFIPGMTISKESFEAAQRRATFVFDLLFTVLAEQSGQKQCRAG